MTSKDLHIDSFGYSTVPVFPSLQSSESTKDVLKIKSKSPAKLRPFPNEPEDTLDDDLGFEEEEIDHSGMFSEGEVILEAASSTLKVPKSSKLVIVNNNTVEKKIAQKKMLNDCDEFKVGITAKPGTTPEVDNGMNAQIQKRKTRSDADTRLEASIDSGYRSRGNSLMVNSTSEILTEREEAINRLPPRGFLLFLLNFLSQVIVNKAAKCDDGEACNCGCCDCCNSCNAGQRCMNCCLLTHGFAFKYLSITKIVTVHLYSWWSDGISMPCKIILHCIKGCGYAINIIEKTTLYCLKSKTNTFDLAILITSSIGCFVKIVAAIIFLFRRHRKVRTLLLKCKNLNRNKLCGSHCCRGDAALAEMQQLVTSHSAIAIERDLLYKNILEETEELLNKGKLGKCLIYLSNLSEIILYVFDDIFSIANIIFTFCGFFGQNEFYIFYEQSDDSTSNSITIAKIIFSFVPVFVFIINRIGFIKIVITNIKKIDGDILKYVLSSDGNSIKRHPISHYLTSFQWRLTAHVILLTVFHLVLIGTFCFKLVISYCNFQANWTTVPMNCTLPDVNPATMSPYIIYNLVYIFICPSLSYLTFFFSNIPWLRKFISILATMLFTKAVRLFQDGKVDNPDDVRYNPISLILKQFLETRVGHDIPEAEIQRRAIRIGKSNIMNITTALDEYEEEKWVHRVIQSVCFFPSAICSTLNLVCFTASLFGLLCVTAQGAQMCTFDNPAESLEFLHSSFSLVNIGLIVTLFVTFLAVGFPGSVVGFFWIAFVFVAIVILLSLPALIYVVILLAVPFTFVLGCCLSLTEIPGGDAFKPFLVSLIVCYCVTFIFSCIGLGIGGVVLITSFISST